jgi:hypothetical protein
MRWPARDRGRIKVFVAEGRPADPWRVTLVSRTKDGLLSCWSMKRYAYLRKIGGAYFFLTEN